MSLMPNFSEIDNSVTRCYALQIIYYSKNQKAIQSVLQSDWSSDSAGSNDECRWGSLLLAEYGHEFSFDEISHRVLPQYLGYVVKRRGCKPEEVAAYAEILNRTMPDSYIKPDAISEVVAFHPEYVTKWMDAELRRNMIWDHHGFYESLCEVLSCWSNSLSKEKNFSGKCAQQPSSDS
ncbi:MAG: hypothetical protein ACTFAK_16550 [Candidatus Electronema sp. VV]